MKIDERLYDVKFVALVPTESAGQVAWVGNTEDAYAALENYLLSLYGPRRYKITQVLEASDVSDNIIRIPITPLQSKEEH